MNYGVSTPDSHYLLKFNSLDYFCVKNRKTYNPFGNNTISQ